MALLRQVIVARQYGITPEIDAFNVSNNIPDLIFSIISGGALSLAFIPILTEYFDKKGTNEAWQLFSRVANLVFITTAFLSLIVAVFAPAIISSPLGVAPGFTHEQQLFTASLMRINLVATLIFSISGLCMGALQSKKHFLLPAIAPLLYNVGQIIGALVLTPVFHMGVYGLAYGVVLGALLHLVVQIPGMLRFGFSYIPSFGLNDKGVQRVLYLMGPRILTVLAIQIMFLARDNVASHLSSGSVTALTYGYFILQVPETLIGTAIATALLPTLSQFAERKEKQAFTQALNKTLRVITSSTLVITVISLLSLDYLLQLLFHFNEQNTQLVSSVTKVYMVGLIVQSLLEITTRAFYAEQNTKTPFVITGIRVVLYLILAYTLAQISGAAGLAWADTITTTFAVVVMGILLAKKLPGLLSIQDTAIRTGLACLCIAAIFYTAFSLFHLSGMTILVGCLVLSGITALVILKKELRLLIHL